MADIVVKLKLDNENVGKINNLKLNEEDIAEVSNTSFKTDASGNYTFSSDNSFSGSEGLSWATGVLNFNRNGMLANNNYSEAYLQSEKQPREFIWNPTDENGQLEVTLTVEGSNISHIIIYGDTVANQFPIEAYIDGDSSNIITSDDARWAIQFDGSSDSHTITFTKWNREQYNACITKIEVMLEYASLTKSKINNLQTMSQTTSDASQLYYGVLANTGSIDLIDTDGELNDLINDGILPISNIAVDVFVNGNKIQEHITNDSNFDVSSNELNIQMSNYLQQLDNLKYSGYVYQNEKASLYNILKDIVSKLVTLDTNTFWYMFDSQETRDFLQGTYVEYPSIEYGKTYREVLDEICTIAQLNLILDEDNNFKFVSARPIYMEDEKIIEIPDNIIYESPNYTKILKNKYDGVEISEVRVDDIVDITVPLYTYKYNAGSLNHRVRLQSPTTSDLNNSLYSSVKLVGSTIGAYVYLRNYYKDFSFEMDKATNQNLEQIIQLEKNPSFNIYSKKRIAQDKNVYAKLNEDTSSGTLFSVVTIDKLTLSPSVFSEPSAEDFITYLEAREDSITVTKEVEYGNSVTVDAETYEDKYIVNCHILYRQETCSLHGTFPLNEPMLGYFKILQVDGDIELTINGNKRKIIFNEIPASTPNIENAKTKAVISYNGSLMQIGTRFQGEKVSDLIKSNILADFSQGISSGTATICPANLYYEDGTLAKDWSKGEIINPYDLIKFKNIDKVWRVTGRTFNYDGEPMIPLEIQEAKRAYLTDAQQPAGLYDDEGKIIYSWETLLMKKYISVNETGNIVTNGQNVPSGYLRFPTSVTEISENAFKGSALTGVLINDNLKYFRYGCFENCKNLVSLDFNSTGYSRDFYGYMLAGCVSLKSFVIPFTVTEISGSMFAGCTSLESVEFAESIDSNATIPSYLTFIGRNAFENCSNLTSITLPVRLNYIQDNSFKGCSSLSSVAFAKTTGWKVTQNDIDFIDIDVSNAETNATNLVTTYVEYGWANNS